MSDLKFNLSKYFTFLWPLGLVPFASGTIASLFSACFCYLINIFFGGFYTIILSVCSGALVWFATKIYIEKNNKKIQVKFLLMNLQVIYCYFCCRYFTYSKYISFFTV